MFLTDLDFYRWKPGQSLAPIEHCSDLCQLANLTVWNIRWRGKKHGDTGSAAAEYLPANVSAKRSGWNSVSWDILILSEQNYIKTFPGIVCMGQGAHCSSQLCLHGVIATEQVSSSLLSPWFPMNWLYQSNSASSRMVRVWQAVVRALLLVWSKIFCSIHLCAGFESQAWPSLEVFEAWYAFAATLENFDFLKHFKHCLFVVIEVTLVSVLSHHP